MNKKNICAPGNQEKCSHTCFRKEHLINMAKILKKKGYKIKTTGTKHQLWDNIKKVLGKKCDDMCMLKKMNMNENEIFKPKMPNSWKNNMNEWLSTTDINKVMKQYENIHKDFIYFGALPSDCPTSFYCSLSNLNLQKLLNNGINKIGIIYNLDPHDKPGSHWVGMFIDNKNKEIDYYDSYGDDIETRTIKRFKNKLMKQMGRGSVYKYNYKRHQYKNSECGIYSINFILNRLKGWSMDKIIKKTPRDDEIQKLRSKFYR